MPDHEDYTEQPLVMFKQDDYHSDNEGDEDEIKMDASVVAGQIMQIMKTKTMKL